jgi:2-phosphosulfolactate phosphatase
LIGTSISGRELSDAGFASDVELAVQLNVSACAPLLRDGAYRAM